jgi:hypothetical protein
MSKLEVNAVEPQCGTNLTLGASGDTIIIPSGATISNQGTAAGFGPTGAVSWNTTKITADPNPAVSGVGYFADTTSAAFTITLPSSPSAGAVVGIADYANTFATNNLTVDRNGSNIGGAATNAILSTNGVSVTFVYVDATQGWIVTDSGNRSDLPQPTYIVATGGTVLTCGDFKTHVFTGPGDFTVCSVGNPFGSNSVEYIVVAGGAGGGVGNDLAQGDGGGGGAGGFRQNYPSPTTAGLPVTAQAYPITVGGGGAAAPNSNFTGVSGSPSIFSTITSAGGGGAGSRNSCVQLALSGGSGGGGGQGDPGNPFYPPTGPNGGVGNTPPVAPPQGNPGGSGFISGPLQGGGGGGGGAGAAGGNGPGPTVGGLGGIGSPIATTVFGPTSPSYGTPGPAPGRYFAGGGGGAGDAPSTGGTGGAGGGGQGGVSLTETAGTVNTGGGGGGGGLPAGAGGSGIVVIRYKFQN